MITARVGSLTRLLFASVLSILAVSGCGDDEASALYFVDPGPGGGGLKAPSVGSVTFRLDGVPYDLTSSVSAAYPAGSIYFIDAGDASYPWIRLMIPNITTGVYVGGASIELHLSSSLTLRAPSAHPMTYVEITITDSNPVSGGGIMGIFVGALNQGGSAPEYITEGTFYVPYVPL